MQDSRGGEPDWLRIGRSRCRRWGNRRIGRRPPTGCGRSWLRDMMKPSGVVLKWWGGSPQGTVSGGMLRSMGYPLTIRKNRQGHHCARPGKQPSEVLRERHGGPGDGALIPEHPVDATGSPLSTRAEPRCGLMQSSRHCRREMEHPLCQRAGTSCGCGLRRAVVFDKSIITTNHGNVNKSDSCRLYI